MTTSASARGLSGTDSPALQSRRQFRTLVDQFTEEHWSRVVDTFGDASLFQTWAYGSTRWGAQHLSHIALEENGSIVAAAQLRVMRPGRLNLGIAYLRWGPLCQLKGHEPDPCVANAMAAALYDEYAQKRGLFLEVLPNAFSGWPRAEVLERAFSKYRRHGGVNSNAYRTFVVDLSPTPSDIRKSLDKKWRNQLSAAERNNLTLTRGYGPAAYNEFRELYSQMWARKRFDTSVDVEEFGRIQNALPAGQKLNILLASDRDVPVAGVIYSSIGDTGLYVLGATTERGMATKASYALQWVAINDLKANGAHSYDLGGIDPDTNPGVFHFKKGMAGTDVRYIDPFSACISAWSGAVVTVASCGRNIWKRLRR